MQVVRADGFAFPPGIGRLAVGWVMLTVERLLVTSKGQTEEITTKHFENGGQIPVSLLFRPRRDRKWLYPLFSNSEGHGAEMSAGLRDKDLHRACCDTPGRLAEFDLECFRSHIIWSVIRVSRWICASVKISCSSVLRVENSLTTAPSSPA